MKLAITVVAPRGYAHSAAFLELAETLQAGARALGHEARVTTEGHLPGHRHVVLGANLLPRHPLALAPGSVLYNLEQVEPGSAWFTPELLALYRQHPLWDYSARNVERLAELGITGVTHVPVGYAPCLTRIAPAPHKDLDVVFVGSLNARRLEVLAALEARGLKVEVGFGVYGARRDALYARAKVVLNLHYYEAKVFEIVRVSYLLANGLCVVSERGADHAEEAAFEGGVLFADYDRLADACVAAVRDGPLRARVAAEGLARIRARPVEALLAPALGALEQRPPASAA